MANPELLIREGQLEEAITALAAILRENPSDTHRRAMLFETLAFAGEHERAAKHLTILGEGNQDTMMGALLYHGALHAEHLRREMFEKETYPGPLGEDASKITGSINGRPFADLTDADPRLGARLEVFGAGDYFWIPFSEVRSIEMQPPARFRDLLWIPARVTTSAQFQRERRQQDFA